MGMRWTDLAALLHVAAMGEDRERSVSPPKVDDRNASGGRVRALLGVGGDACAFRGREGERKAGMSDVDDSGERDAISGPREGERGLEGGGREQTHSGPSQ